jgi:hypothetical protein
MVKDSTNLTEDRYQVLDYNEGGRELLEWVGKKRTFETLPPAAALAAERMVEYCAKVWFGAETPSPEQLSAIRKELETKP